jgi:curved DNA-binding protein
MDYYDCLGVSRNASEKELKKAYKKQSMKHHPDRGGDEEEFKKVNEAYTVLSNPEKKAMYDQYGTADPQQAGGFNHGGFEDAFGGNFDDVFSQMFGQQSPFGHRHQRQRNRTLRIQIGISLEQAYNGHEATITFPLTNGSDKTVNVKIPKGIDAGQTIRLAGIGDNSIPGIPPGDLNIIVTIHDTRGFTRNGNDLHSDLTINVFDLIIGTKAPIKHLNGHEYSLNIKAGTQPGTTLCMKELGMPDVRGRGVGHLYITIKGVVPQNLTPEQKEMIIKVKENN